MSSKNFDVMVTKDQDGNLLDAPVSVTYTATLTESTFTIGDICEMSRRDNPEWATVEDGIAWFIKETETSR